LSSVPSPSAASSTVAERYRDSQIVLVNGACADDAFVRHDVEKATFLWQVWRAFRAEARALVAADALPRSSRASRPCPRSTTAPRGHAEPGFDTRELLAPEETRGPRDGSG